MEKNLTDQLSQVTLEYLKNRPKIDRSPLGQFITPRLVREKLISELRITSGMRVLDPGVGTGEFLRDCLDAQPGIYAEGWDIDPKVLGAAKNLVPEAILKEQSALEVEWKSDFNLVIGNPPYFEMKKLSPELRKKYSSVIGGRPNIFSLFIAAGLGALQHGGHLAFVVPPSMNNGAFFTKLRNYIMDQASIEYLYVFENNKLFDDALTAVQLLVLKKGAKSDKYFIDLGKITNSHLERIIFADEPEKFEEEFKGRSTLWDLGYEATTGKVVWNQHKNKLSNQKTPNNYPLLWAHNISQNKEIVLNDQHPKKLQYIEKSNPELGPSIIVNRITGSVGSGSLRCAFVPDKFEYFGENHINVIKKRVGVNQKVDWDELLLLLRNPQINSRIQKLTGNTQVSCIELTHWLPIGEH